MTQPKPVKPRRRYRAKDAVIRSVRICGDAFMRNRGAKTGAVKLFAYGYDHIAAVTGFRKSGIQKAVEEGRLDPRSLASIIAYAARDPRRLRKLIDAEEEKIRRRQPQSSTPHADGDE